MSLIEVSVPSRASGDQLECYSVATTDFDSYEIPKPVSGFRGGTNDDVLIYFEDLEEMTDYISKLGFERNVSNSTECRTLKLQRIIASIGLVSPLEEMKATFFGKSFIETNSNHSYRFTNDTLNIDGNPSSKYRIIKKDDGFYLESELDNVPLFIDNIDLYEIKLINKDNGKIRANLRPE
ncbi:hypothetical protein [Mucilaginibacter sp. SG564]|uniref:hypothetical protein n=1 Tax=Mucilaginibacter sp. SG564 TaxID=2587022 RepID=UPI0015562D06|nr:hypothetical protein [Mucilaginibacter sp. SG564]NOW94005.1 hypothetical protein [Mucilaginibacter sp. SG564]